jgi:hypothetical protein
VMCYHNCVACLGGCGRMGRVQIVVFGTAHGVGRILGETESTESLWLEHRVGYLCHMWWFGGDLLNRLPVVYSQFGSADTGHKALGPWCGWVQ